MEPTTIATAGAVINLLLGGVIWFMKQSYTEIKDTLKEQQRELANVKDTYYKKEDFREFKEELWIKLDKMEMNWTQKLNELHK